MLVDMRWISDVGVRWGKDEGAVGVGGAEEVERAVGGGGFLGGVVEIWRIEVSELAVGRRWRGIERWEARESERGFTSPNLRGGLERDGRLKAVAGYVSGRDVFKGLANDMVVSTYARDSRKPDKLKRRAPRAVFIKKRKLKKKYKLKDTILSS